MELFEKMCKGLECCATSDLRVCKGCPYNGQPCSDLCLDALSMLRSQQARIKELEAAQQPSLLTLEEIDHKLNSATKEYETIFWAEVKSLKRISFGVFNLDFSMDGGYEALLLGCSWPFHYRRETYGITWRCWTSKPTDKQREAIPWG